MISTVNLTVRVDEVTKKEFDTFCENVGLNATSAVNMFIRAVVRTRALPFIVTDANVSDQALLAEMKRAIQSMREQSARNGNSDMGLDEIDDEIAASRLTKRGQ
jgi:DNA-damage-inducible protein J